MSRAEEVLKGLASLREENVLCDVQLEAEGQHISAHKAVLAAASPYFKGMFAGRFKETKEEVVAMKEVKFQGLRSVIECIYTTKITLDMTNIEQVMPVAHLLQMNDIVKECVEWMDGKITTANCLQLLEIAEKFCIEKLVSKVNDFILKNFVTVSEMKGFCNVSRPALVKYLFCDTLKTNIGNEFAAYKAARKWILANEPPAEGVEEIMSCVRFGLIKPDQLMKEILPDPIVQVSKKCQELITEAVLYHTNLFTQPLYEGTLNKPRGKAGLLVIPNGDKADRGFNVTDDHVDMDFISFPGLMGSNLCSRLDITAVYESMTSIHMNNFLYFFGVNGKFYQNFAKRYNASVDKWLELAPVPGPTVVGRAIAKYGGQIFLLGGMTVDKQTEFIIDSEQIIDNVYMYDISQNKWSESNAMPMALLYSAAAEVNGNIYVTGGHADEASLKKVWAYDIKAQMWLTKAPMNHRRCQQAIQALGDKLYVFGGRQVDGDRYENTKSTEMYDPLANQWTILLNNVPDTHSCSSFVSGNKVYLVGGQDYFHALDEVHVYDIEKKTIQKLRGKLPSDCERHVSAFMILPKLL